MRHFGLQLKFILVILCLLLLIFGSLTFELVRNNANNLRNDLKQQSLSFATLSVEPIGNAFLTYKDSGQIQIHSQVQQYLQLDSSISNVAVTDINGNVVYSQSPSYPSHVNSQDASSFTQVVHYDSSGNVSTIFTPLIEESGQHQYAVIYTVSAAAVQGTLRQSIIGGVITGFTGLIISIAVTFAVMNWLFISPIHFISRQALLISGGKLDEQIAFKRGDEIGDLSKALNAMANSLKTDIQKLKQVDSLKSEFMMISSHNLRTPLTIIQGYIEALKERPLDQQAAKLVEIVEANTARLKVFAENMLVISQIEAGQTANEPHRLVNSTQFFEQIGQQFKTLAAAKSLTPQVTVPPDLPKISIQPRRFHDGIWNVLDNAIKFTNQGGNVAFTVSQPVGQRQLQITIDDTGIGIPSDELTKLFTKFHRGTSTMTYNYEGVGIGLYLAKLIVEEHGGHIELTSTANKGTKAKITIPLPDISAQPTDFN